MKSIAKLMGAVVVLGLIVLGVMAFLNGQGGQAQNVTVQTEQTTTQGSADTESLGEELEEMDDLEEIEGEFRELGEEMKGLD